MSAFVYLHYNDDGSIVKAYDESCLPYIPEPNVRTTHDAWTDAVRNNRERYVDVTKTPHELHIGDPQPWPETEAIYSKLSVMRELKAISATIRDGVEGTLWDVVWQKLQELDQTDEWLATSWLSSTDAMVKQLLAWLRAKYPELDIDSILSRCLY